MGAFLSVVSGLFGGVGAVLIWEIWLKPRRERRILASLILAEVIQNTRYIRGYLKIRETQPNHIPEEFHIPTLAFDAVIARLGELPPKALGHILQIYRNVGDANRVALVYHTLLREYREMTPDDARREGIRREIGVTITMFFQFLESIPGSMNALLRPLSDIALGKKAVWDSPELSVPDAVA
jgi:hypothetical protein